MTYVLPNFLVLSVVYAVIGNAIVYIVLARRKVPVRSMWAGTLTYLYRVCVGAEPTVGATLRRLAFSTNVAFLVAILLGLGLASVAEAAAHARRTMQAGALDWQEQHGGGTDALHFCITLKVP